MRSGLMFVFLLVFSLPFLAGGVNDVDKMLADLDSEAKPETAVKASAKLPQVKVEKTATETESAPKKEAVATESKITSTRMDYDRKEGVIYFEENVHVDDAQYQMHADRVYVFLQGTNDVKRIVALGNVAITNEQKVAQCNKATFYRNKSQVVMHGWQDRPAVLIDGSGSDGMKTVTGTKIKFYLDSEQVEVENNVISLPPGTFNAGDAKSLLGK